MPESAGVGQSLEPFLSQEMKEAIKSPTATKSSMMTAVMKAGLVDARNRSRNSCGGHGRQV